MTVTIPTDLEQAINRHVQSGSLDSPDEVIREGLRLLEAQGSIEGFLIDEPRQRPRPPLEQLRFR